MQLGGRNSWPKRLANTCQESDLHVASLHANHTRCQSEIPSVLEEFVTLLLGIIRLQAFALTVLFIKVNVIG